MEVSDQIKNMLDPYAKESKRAISFYYLFLIPSLLVFVSITDADLVGIGDPTVNIPILNYSISKHTFIKMFFFSTLLFHAFVSHKFAEYCKRFLTIRQIFSESSKHRLYRSQLFLTPFIGNNLFFPYWGKHNWFVIPSIILILVFIPSVIYGFATSLGVRFANLTGDAEFGLGAFVFVLQMYSYILLGPSLAKTIEINDRAINTKKFHNWRDHFTPAWHFFQKHFLGGRWARHLLNLTAILAFLFTLFGSSLVKSTPMRTRLQLYGQNLSRECDHSPIKADWHKSNNKETSDQLETQFILKFCKGRDLSRFTFIKADLRLTTGHRCIFGKTSFQGANAYEADFRGSFFIGADLKQADFSHADLSYSMLKNSDLSYTNLAYANLNHVTEWHTLSSMKNVNIYNARINKDFRSWLIDNGAISITDDQWHAWKKDGFPDKRHPSLKELQRASTPTPNHQNDAK